MPEYRNQIVGLIRFSYPSLSGFKHGLKEGAASQAMLFEPARLERRFHLFRSLCLPSLLAQRDGDFTCIFLIGEAMPKSARQHLADLVAPLKDARIHAEPPRHHYPVQKAAFGTVPQTGFSHRTTFRLDDDDAVDLDYIARLKRVSTNLRPFCSDETPVAIAFNRGFYVSLSPEGNEVFDAVERAPLSVGTALMTPAGHPDNIYARNHRFLPQFFDTFSDAATPSYIRAIHRDNDSNPTIMGRTKEMSEDQIARVLNAQFAVDLPGLLAL